MVVNWEKLMNRRSFMRLISSAFVVDDGQKKKKKKESTDRIERDFSEILP